MPVQFLVPKWLVVIDLVAIRDLGVSTSLAPLPKFYLPPNYGDLPSKIIYGVKINYAGDLYCCELHLPIFLLAYTYGCQL
jgi:hypothetical protein